MERRPERGIRRDDPWTRERAQRRRLLGMPEHWSGERRATAPGREWEHERTGGPWRGDDAAWERSPREPEPPRPGYGSAWASTRGATRDDESARGGASYDYDEPWRSERYREREDDFPPGRGSYEDDLRDSPGDFGERSYAGYGDWSSRAIEEERGVRHPRTEPMHADRRADDARRSSAARWGLGRSGARDEWGADLRGAVEARAGRFAGRGPRGYQRSDERIRENVCDLLLEASHVDASGFDVQVSGGEVTLEGAVADRRMKRDAEDLVEQVPGVTQVHNHLRIDTARINGAVDANGHAVQ
ncbi:MAG: BON domain-containing protein [Candidatus Binatia bacterium]